MRRQEQLDLWLVLEKNQEESSKLRKPENIVEETKVLSEAVFGVYKCPNCDELSYNEEKWCSECWYWVKIEETNKKYFYDENIDSKKLEKRIKFSLWNFETYKVIKDYSWKIEQVLFKFKKSKFLVYISYVKKDFELKEKLYSEQERASRDISNQIDRVLNLRIISIFKKVRNWYGEKKISANYFNFMWLNNSNLEEFIYEFLKNNKNL